MTNEQLKAIRDACHAHQSKCCLIELNPPTVIALLDEIESLRKDAEKYRLRVALAQAEIAVMLGSPVHPEQVDAAIDAAMEGGK